MSDTRHLNVASNPYWLQVGPYAKPSRLHTWEDSQALVVGEPDWTATPGTGEPLSMFELRRELVRRYAFTITDPHTIGFVVEAAENRPILDPLAGSGYWGAMLAQAGLDVLCTDIAPPPNHEYYRLSYFHTDEMDGAESAARHGADRTLFLSWPPYAERVGHDVIEAYPGDRMIFIGEYAGGCTGDDAMWSLIESQWVEVRTHRPVQWFGIHDYVTLYRRRSAVL